jgi:MFS family permease
MNEPRKSPSALQQSGDGARGQSYSLDTHNSQQERQPSRETPRDASEELRPPDYTTFTRPQRHLLTLLVGLAAITSPLTATIYLPLLPILRTRFQTDAQAINLTLSIYVIFQAISPMLFGPPSDNLGRRPILMLTISIYCAGNIGLALNKSSYAALLVLRAVQSLGASAAYAIAYGIVADVCLPGERGRMLGPINMALNVGTCIGPIVGGWVSYKSDDYEGVFWALVVLGFVLLGGTLIFLPETARSLVGNGIGRSRSARYQSVWSVCRGRYRKHDGLADRNTGVQQPPLPRLGTTIKWIRANNPLNCLRILTHRDAMLTLFMHGSFYVVDYSMVAAAPDIYKGIYHLNDLHVGLTYLPRGIGIITGSYFNGKLMDHNYKHVAEAIGWTSVHWSTAEFSSFPFERARTRGSLWLLCFSTAGLVLYGWMLWLRVHMAVPLMLQYLLGFVQTCFYTIYSTLLVDSFPDRPSTAAAAASVVRCAMAATALAILQPMLEAAGLGWYFTALGIWSGGFGALAIFVLRRKGMKWRMERSSDVRS